MTSLFKFPNFLLQEILYGFWYLLIRLICVETTVFIFSSDPCFAVWIQFFWCQRLWKLNRFLLMHCTWLQLLETWLAWSYVLPSSETYVRRNDNRTVWKLIMKKLSRDLAFIVSCPGVLVQGWGTFNYLTNLRWSARATILPDFKAFIKILTHSLRISNEIQTNWNSRNTTNLSGSYIPKDIQRNLVDKNRLL